MEEMHCSCSVMAGLQHGARCHWSSTRAHLSVCVQVGNYKSTEIKHIWHVFDRMAITYQFEMVSSWTGLSCCELEPNCRFSHATAQGHHHGWISLDKMVQLNSSQRLQVLKPMTPRMPQVKYWPHAGHTWVDAFHCLAPDCHKITCREPALDTLLLELNKSAILW